MFATLTSYLQGEMNKPFLVQIFRLADDNETGSENSPRMQLILNRLYLALNLQNMIRNVYVYA